MTFGQKLRKLREEKGITQQLLATKLGYVTNSYIADAEKGKFIPSKKKLKKIAKVLNFGENTENWYTLMDLAAITHIPKELLSNQSIVDKLPVFFRTLRGQKPTRDELEELIKLIKEG